MPKLLLAGDIGGTKTLLGLFAPAPDRPARVTVQTFPTQDHAGLPQMVESFLQATAESASNIAAACFGAAGPVIDDTVTLTNVRWRVDGPHIAKHFGFRCVRLLNDLQAMAHALPVLADRELHVLQEGRAAKNGAMALIAAGTGLGEAMLHLVDGRRIASPTEAGHADFAARTPREMKLVDDLIARFGRADNERVISGLGLVNVHRSCHPTPCAANIDLADPNAPAAITTAAIHRRCAGCVETLDLFVDAYGAEAGNLALRSVATGGVFVGGGIAPKILPALVAGGFLRAFAAKAPLDAMLRAIPVKIVLNQEAGLVGAAVAANSIEHERQ